MPVFLAPFAGLALGAALAWLSRGDARRDGEQGERARTIVAALFGALVFAPVCAWFALVTPDWSLAYLVDSRRVPSAFILIVLLLDAATVPIGFVAGRRATRSRVEAMTAMTVGVPAAITVAGLLALLPRLRVEGTFHQVKSNFGTQPVAGGELGWAILWMGAALVAGFLVAVRGMTSRRVAPMRAGSVEGEPDRDADRAGAGDAPGSTTDGSEAGAETRGYLGRRDR